LDFAAETLPGPAAFPFPKGAAGEVLSPEEYGSGSAQFPGSNLLEGRAGRSFQTPGRQVLRGLAIAFNDSKL
jgi:hypothetical protein